MKEEPSLWLKFSGEELDVRSIPIYELGDTLIAVQRIIHKTFQFENGRLKKGVQLTQAERKRGVSGFLCLRRWETFPRRRSALATNRATRWESRSSSYAMGLVNRSA
jgi:hypothetical protein